MACAAYRSAANPGAARMAVVPAGRYDGPVIHAFIAALPPHTRYLRFMHAVRALPAAVIESMLTFDPPRAATLLGFDLEAPGALTGIAQYAASEQPGSIEVAVVVADDRQRQGIGSVMLRELARIARFGGFRRASATVLSDNHAAIALARRFGASLTIEPGNAQLTRVEAALRPSLWPGQRGADRPVASGRVSGQKHPTTQASG